MSDEFSFQPMYDAIAKASVTWGRVENAMASLLKSLLGWTDQHEALHIYFAPSNTETRFKIVDTIVRLRWDGYTIHDLKSEWASVMLAVGRAKETRNRIAHGEVQGPGRKQKDGTWVHQARLVASSLDISRRRKEPVDQWPGLSAHDVVGAANRFFWLAVRIEELRNYRNAQVVGPQISLPDIFARIIERRQNCGPLKGEPNVPEPLTPAPPHPDGPS